MLWLQVGWLVETGRWLARERLSSSLSWPSTHPQKKSASYLSTPKLDNLEPLSKLHAKYWGENINKDEHKGS
jgi:hypothetical protein